jgi:O-antigen/teichoic acid export membrane protein
MAIEGEILKTASLATISKIISVFASILTLPLLLQSIGKDDYGLFVLISSLTGYLGLMTFGVTSTLKNKIIETYNKQDYIETNLIISSVFSVYFFIFILNIILFSIATFSYPEIYYNLLNGYTIVDDTKYVFFLLIFTSMVNTFIGSVFINCYHGINKLNFLARLQAWIVIVTTVFYVIFLFYEPNLFAVVVFNLVRSIFIIAINYFYLKKQFIQLKIYISKEALNYFTKLKKSSYYFFIASLLTIMTTTADYIMISKFYSTSEITIFSISQKIYLIIASALPIAYSSWPVVGKYYHANKSNALHMLFYKTIRLNIITKVTFMLPVFLSYPLIVKYWLGESYVTDTSIYLSFFIIFANNTVLGIFSLFFSATENQKYLIFITFVNLIVNVYCSLYIFYIYELGILSFLIGTIISQYIIFGLYLLKYKKIFKKSISIRYLFKHFIHFCVIGTVLFITLNLFDIYERIDAIKFMILILLNLSYFTYIYYVVLKRIERTNFINFIKKMAHR